MKPPYKSPKNDEIDFFALWEKKQSKSNIEFTNDLEYQEFSKAIADEKEYTKKDLVRRIQIQRAKEELYLLATSQDIKINKVTKESHERKRREFINIKKIIQSEINTSRYRKSS